MISTTTSMMKTRKTKKRKNNHNGSVPVEALVAKAVKHDTGVSHGGAENVPPCFLLKIKQMFHRNAGESRTEKYQPAMNQTKTDNIRSEDEKGEIYEGVIEKIDFQNKGRVKIKDTTVTVKMGFRGRK